MNVRDAVLSHLRKGPQNESTLMRLHSASEKHLQKTLRTLERQGKICRVDEDVWKLC